MPSLSVEGLQRQDEMIKQRSLLRSQSTHHEETMNGFVTFILVAFASCFLTTIEMKSFA